MAFKFSANQNFLNRLLFGILAALFVLVAIFFSGHPYFRPVFVLITAAIIGMALWEYYQLTIAKGFRPLVKIGITFSVLYAICIYLETQWDFAAPLPTIVLGAALLIGFLHDFRKNKESIGNLATTVFGIVYLAVPLSCLITIVYSYPQKGRLWLLYLLLVTKITDTGAYFVGKLFGRSPLAPEISPKKTWEGAAGGFITAVVTSYLFSHLLHPFKLHLPLMESLLLGGFISIFAMLGDLSESLLKRDAGIKDSNNIPGLGGALDVVDSLIFTTPLMCLYLKLQ